MNFLPSVVPHYLFHYFAMLNRSFSLSFFIVFLFILLPVRASAEMVSVSGDDVNLRGGPGTTYSVKWRYGSGFPLRVIDKKGEWLKVEDFENDTGWLHRSLIKNTGFMIVKANKDSDKRINIRSGPGTQYKIVGMAHYGVVFKTIKQQQGWAHVRHESGLEGWIKRTLLWGF
ncbi:SH3 domain-containing protein [Desulfofustis glycolicus]|uniref:SH3-like domain-containing protein n=1 Tax=Desulfofustis glycolicus DSM 9705 TaxID=1121409 RepID=A0A1M5WJR4_9BACT|nr:SH3 domain-containing protein [Desulfofustis glycolicus]SHH87786.1 SH3-like domain-containing protein [Desulfofustis glycolicus DSM 9705]